MISARAYQLESIASLYEGWAEDGIRHQLVSMATGCGKTVVFSLLAKRVVEEGGRVLILAHTDELIDQAIDKFQRATGMVAGREKASSYASRANKVVVGSVQTMVGALRLSSWPKNHFTVIVVDEAHRSLAASYQKVLAHFIEGGAKVVGVTATADRGDKRALGEFFQRVAYDYGLLRAVRDGWLVRPIVKTMPVQIDLRGVQTKQTTDGSDLDREQVGQRLAPFMDSIAAAIKAEVGAEKVLLFLPSVETAQIMAGALNKAGVSADWVCGDKKLCPDRAARVARHKKGEFQALANMSILTEGYDDDTLRNIVCLRATKIRSLYCLDSKTEVLTERGWLGIGDTIDCRVAAFNPADSSISWSYAGRIQRPLMQGESFYGIENPHLSIRVTNRHNMVICQRRGRANNVTPWTLVAAEDTPGEFRVPVSGIQSTCGVKLTDDEIRFIGLLMTDGSVSKYNNQATIYQSERYPAVLEYVRRTLRGCGFKFNELTTSSASNFGPRRHAIHRFTVSFGKPRRTDKHLRGWGELAPFFSKQLSDSMELANQRQLKVLLEAMHAGDGCKKVAKSDTYSICTSRRALADRLQSLCVRRGIRCNIAQHRDRMFMVHASIEQCSYWSIIRSSSDNRPTFGRVDSIDGAQVWCVQVNTGAIVTRRNGKVAIVGNCQIIGRGTRPIGTIVPQLNAAANAWERCELIRNSEKPHVKILDFLWQYEKHDLCTPASLVTKDERVAELMSGKDGDLIEVEAQAERDLLKKLEEEVKKNARRKSQVVDPLALATELHDVELADYEATTAHESGPVSEKQARILTGNGIAVTKVKNYGHAHLIISRILARHAKGLCTVRQLNFFKKIGVDASNWTKEQASRAQQEKIMEWQRRRKEQKQAAAARDDEVAEVAKQLRMDIDTAVQSDRRNRIHETVPDPSAAHAAVEIEDFSEIFG